MMNIPTTLDLRPVIPWTLNSGHLKTFREFRKPDSSIIFPTCADSLVLTLDSFVRGSYIVIDGITYTIKNHIGNGSYGYVASVESPGPLGTLGNTSYILKKITCKPGIKSGDGGVTIYNKKRRYLEQKQNVIIECVNQQIISLFDNNLAPRIIKIAKTVRVGVEETTFYIIMEFLEGVDAQQFLSSQIDDGTKKDAIVTMMRSLAKFTRSAYDKYRFIHGDMKPDNLFRCNDGTIRYIDFGFSNLKFDITNNDTQIIAMPDFAWISQPTRDLTMLASFLYKLHYDFINSTQELSIGFDKILYNAVCDTSDIANRGDIVRPHPSHFLDLHATVPPLSNPPNRRLLDLKFPGDMSWRDQYSYLCEHNNINATPENVLLVAFPEIGPNIPNIPDIPDSPYSPDDLIIQPNITDQFLSASSSNNSTPTSSTNYSSISSSNNSTPTSSTNYSSASSSNNLTPTSSTNYSSVSSSNNSTPTSSTNYSSVSSTNNSTPTSSTNNSSFVSSATTTNSSVGGFKKLTTILRKNRSNKKKRNVHNKSIKFIKFIKSIKNLQQTRSAKSKKSRSSRSSRSSRRRNKTSRL